MIDDHLLSKSTFLRGVQCNKSLYLDHHHHDLRDPVDPGPQRRMVEGLAVHVLARDLFPGGTLVRAEGSFDFQNSLLSTQKLIEEGETVLYEAAIQHQGVLTFVDLLVRDGEAWTMYEVKSSTKVKEDYHWDVALQVHLLNACGLQVADAYVVHLNGMYIRQGELDLETLFTKVSILDEALALHPQVIEEINLHKKLLEGSEIPDIDIGPYCKDPFQCDFKGYCWAHVPEISVFNVYYLGKKAFELYNQGVLHIEDISDDYPLSSRSRFHVDAHKSGEEIVDREAILAFLSGLTYPLYHLDFETFATAIPPFDGIKPYAQVPYQYSLHVQNNPGEEPTHSGFLAKQRTDPRRPLVEKLLQSTEGHGDILAYYMSFEKRVLRDLGERFPEYQDALEDRIARMQDLILPFQKRYLYLPEMHGSSSLKAVLPALVPEMSYQALEISDGTQAMEAYFQLQEATDTAEIERIRKALWEYCKLDTLAMVRILAGLEKATVISKTN